MRKLAILLLALLLPCFTLAEDADTALWDYILTDEGAVLTTWDYGDVLVDRSSVVEIPAELDGHPLVGIGYNALNTSEMDSEISFTLVVPEGVTFLEEVAFQCCHNAEAIHLPASLTEIPEGCFHHVGAEITVAEGNPRYTVQDGFLIDQQTGTLLYAAPSATGKALPALRRLARAAWTTGVRGRWPPSSPRAWRKWAHSFSRTWR